jgi:hypothetical protein
MLVKRLLLRGPWIKARKFTRFFIIKFFKVGRIAIITRGRHASKIKSFIKIINHSDIYTVYARASFLISNPPNE